MIWKRRIHRARLWLQAAFAAVAILLALAMGLVQIALPWIVSHPQRISAFLSERLQRPVTLERVEGHWENDGPLLVLHAVHIGGSHAGAPGSTISQAELKINFFSALHRNLAWNEFRLVGLNLHLAKDKTGQWQMSGLDAGDPRQRSGEDSVLFELGAMVLRDLHVSIDDGKHPRVDLLADEVRLVNSGNAHRVLARVRCADTHSAPLDVVLDYNAATRAGEAYVGGSSVDLAALARGFAPLGVRVERGAGRAQLWGWWQHDRLARVRAQVDVHDVVLASADPIALDATRNIAARVAFDRLSFAARWQRDAAGWQADVGDLVMQRQGLAAPMANIHLSKQQAADAPQATYAVDVGALHVSAPASLAMLSNALSPQWRRWLYIADPAGSLRNLSVRFGGTRDFDLHADLDALAWHAVDKIPGATSISGNLLGDADGFALHLPPQAAFGFDAAHVFRQPLEFSNFAGDVAAWRGDAGWCIGTDAIEFQGAGYAGQLRGSVQLHADGSRPDVDVSAVIDHADVAAARLFWPINVMPPAAVHWLDRGLVGGRVAAGRAVIHGDLADWPFNNLSGRFEARAEIAEAKLSYLPDWPAADQVTAVADFVNNGLHVDATSAKAMANAIDRASADIPDLAEAVLDLDVSGSGTGKALLDFLKATPIGARYASHLLGVSVGGSGKVKFHLHLPVKQTEALQLDGTVAIAKADLVDAQYALRLQQASGTLTFSQDGFDTGELPLLRDDKPATFRLAVGAFASNPEHAVEGSLQAHLPIADLLGYAPMLSAYGDHLSGAANWKIGFNADRDDVPHPAQRLTVESDLVGIGSDLPEPLSKAADATLPLALTLGLPVAGAPIDLQLGTLLHLRGRMASDTQAFAARVDFAADSDAALPSAGFSIGGSAAQLDLSGWMDFAVSNSAGGGEDLVSGIDMQTANLRAWDRDFGAAQFTLVPDKQALALGFHGTNIDGSLRVPLADLHTSGITAQFSKLYWPDVGEDETSASTGENPANVPPLHIRIGDFRLGHSRFGDTTLESYPIAGGTHFDQVTTHSSNVEMRAHGDWTGRPGADVSTFSIDFSARNLGRMLDTFGYAGVIDGGATVAHVEGHWNGSPSMFSLAHLDGTLKVSVAEGRIPDADPGAGRLLGLINVSAIPRRLALDFGDFFTSGFSFDSIKGVFTLKDGNAYTTDLKVKGTAADVVISGRAGLKAKDYDQVMDVTPHVGGTLMIGGAIVGGPVGAAAGAVIQGLFKKALNDVTRVRYSVTGSWEKPRIEELSKELRKSAAPAQPPEKSSPAPTAPLEPQATPAAQTALQAAAAPPSKH